MNRNIIKSLPVLLLIIFLFSDCGRDKLKDRSLERIKSRGFFIAGVNDEFPPMVFRAKENMELTGFDIDLAKEAAKRLGVKVQFKSQLWDGILMSLNSGDIDVIWTGLTRTDERKQKIDFTKPYLNNRQIIMVTTGCVIDNFDTLKDKKVGVQLGSASEIALNSDTGLIKILKEVKKYQNNTLALIDLSAKKVDAVVLDEIVGRWNMAKKPGIYKVLSEDLGNELYSIGIRKDDLTFKEALDKALHDIKNDKTGEEISKKWFGENIFFK